jgi:alkylation response protein AidB-like acyl-CoA dehydrogenase
MDYEMNFELDPKLERIQKQARELAADFATRASQHDQEGIAPDENYAKLKQAGFYGLVAPKQYGGSGAGVLGWVVAAEELAQGCPSTAVSFNMRQHLRTRIGQDQNSVPYSKGMELTTFAADEEASRTGELRWLPEKRLSQGWPNGG